MFDFQVSVSFSHLVSCFSWKPEYVNIFFPAGVSNFFYPSGHSQQSLSFMWVLWLGWVMYDSNKNEDSQSQGLLCEHWWRSSYLKWWCGYQHLYTIHLGGTQLSFKKYNLQSNSVKTWLCHWTDANKLSVSQETLPSKQPRKPMITLLKRVLLYVCNIYLHAFVCYANIYNMSNFFMSFCFLIKPH